MDDFGVPISKLGNFWFVSTWGPSLTREATSAQVGIPGSREEEDSWEGGHSKSTRHVR